MHIVSAKVIASCFGVSVFAVALIAGLASGNSAISILFRALVATALCYPVGIVVGMICAWLIREQVNQINGSQSTTSPPLRGDEAVIAAELQDEQAIIV